MSKELLAFIKHEPTTEEVVQKLNSLLKEGRLTPTDNGIIAADDEAAKYLQLKSERHVVLDYDMEDETFYFGQIPAELLNGKGGR